MKPKDLTIVPCALIEVRDFVERNHYSHNITGKVYHSRALRTKYKGKYKPFVERLCNKKHLGLLEESDPPLPKGKGFSVDANYFWQAFLSYPLQPGGYNSKITNIVRCIYISIVSYPTITNPNPIR